MMKTTNSPFYLDDGAPEKYKALSPRTFILNTAIHELFDKGQNKRIDLLTDYPYLQTWSNKCIPRINTH